MAYKQTAFIKIKGGEKAPEGFHYMPSGKLMSDKDHVARYGYVEKKIKKVDIDYSDIASGGGLKTIAIKGDPGIIFSIEVYEGDQASYYNFKTKTWSTIRYKQTNVQSISGIYSTGINFPAQASLKTFTINIYAETIENTKTIHRSFLEIRNKDGSLNLNKSSGSDSNVVKKILYQDVLKNLNLSVFAPDSREISTVVKDSNSLGLSNRMVLSTDIVVGKHLAIGDTITCTGILESLGVTVTKVNPDGDNPKELEMSALDIVAGGTTISFIPALRGLLPSLTSTTGRAALEVESGSSGSFEFTITIKSRESRGLAVTRLPTTEDLCFINEVTFGAAGTPITGEDITDDVSGDPVFYRWPVTNIANLANGMTLDPARAGTGANTTTAAISDYRKDKKLRRINKSNRYYTDFEDYTEQDVYVNGIDSAGNPVTAIDRNGRVTAQAGNVAFSRQQDSLLASDADVLIIAQGAEAIQQATGMQVLVSNTTITSAQVFTTTTAASSASTTIALTAVENIVVGQTVRGVGINYRLNPTVVSKSVAAGAGNIVVNSAQTLEDGATLFFDGYSNSVILQGRIAVKNMAITDTNLFFDAGGFLSVS